MQQKTMKLAEVEVGHCVACGACMQACPRKAVSVFRGCHAMVDADICIGCGICARTCPAGCISVKQREGAK